jgi:hypothetical protein
MGGGSLFKVIAEMGVVTIYEAAGRIDQTGINLT